MKWSMCVCDTKTASIGSRTPAGVRSIRPRSTSTARPCQRSPTSSAGSPVCPFSRRGRSVVFMERSDSMEARADWPAADVPAITPRVEGRGVERGLALHLLQDQRRGLAHHLLHDLPHRLVDRLELLDQPRQKTEVALLGVQAHGGQAGFHRLHEPSVRGGDLAVEILLQRALVHARSIEGRLRAFNAIAPLVLAA